jgi:purine-binding chemotaxis protein CheW
VIMAILSNSGRRVGTRAVPENDTADDRGGPDGQAVWLLCRIGYGFGALPLDQVVEIMRVLPVEAVASAPAYIRGLAVLRGKPVPVVDLGILLGLADFTATRLVSLKIGSRNVALAVEGVYGVGVIDEARLGDLPPLLRDAAGEAVAAIGMLDAELLFVLQAGRLVPEDVLDQFGAES